MTDAKWDAVPGEVGGVTEYEVGILAVSTTPYLRHNLQRAAFALHIAKLKTGDVTPWKTLLEAYRKSEPVQVEIEVIDLEGAQRNQVVFRERGYGLKGVEQLMFSSIQNFAVALDAIEKVPPGDHDSKLVRTHIGIVNAGLSGHDQMLKAKDRIRSEYIGAKHGTGKKIKSDICADCDIHPKTFDNYVRAVKDE
jgi:hypothetical protein